MKRFLPVAGTWGYRDTWHVSGPFIEFMAGHGFTPIRDEDGEPFRWSGRLAGLAGWLRKIPLLNRIPFVQDDTLDWQASGDGLAYFMDDDVPYWDRCLIGHSHAGPVIAYACLRRKIRVLITIGTPHRLDMDAVWAKARARQNIGFWVHVYDADRDDIGQAGAAGDGVVSCDRSQPHADVNLPLKGIGHSGLLNNPALFDLWVRRGLLDVLAGTSTLAAARGNSPLGNV